MKILDHQVQRQVDDLTEQGNSFSTEGHYLDAARCYCQALALFPDSLERRPEIVHLLTSIGDSLFHIGRYKKAIEALSDAIRCGGLGDSLIHLRLGQSQYEIGNQDKAADELTRAYMAEGEIIFEKEPAHYFDFLKTKIIL